ncbi:hypothetical protein GCM10023237_02230 [Streptomyces coeruleoprunus]
MDLRGRSAAGPSEGMVGHSPAEAPFGGPGGVLMRPHNRLADRDGPVRVAFGVSPGPAGR